MESNELYQLIGQIVYSFGRIDFLISNIAAELGLSKSYTDFFAKSNFAKKIESLKEKTNQASIASELKSQLSSCLDLLEQFRIIRNNLTHSIILNNEENSDELLLHNFTKNGNEVKWTIVQYSSDDLRKFNKEFIHLHNQIYTILGLIKHHS
jgi:hypothetical protein